LMVEFILFGDGFLEAVILDHPEILEVHQEGSENCDKLFEFLRLDFSDRDNFLSGKSLLSADQQSNQLLELFLIIEQDLAPEIKHIIKQVFNILDMSQSLDV
jgi:hypothetical protein